MLLFFVKGLHFFITKGTCTSKLGSVASRCLYHTKQLIAEQTVSNSYTYFKLPFSKGGYSHKGMEEIKHFLYKNITRALCIFY